jgi:uncharacterized protein (DUF885 family)
MSRVLWPILASLLIVTGCSEEEAARPAASATAGEAAADASADPAGTIDAIADAYVGALFEHFPESATFYRIAGATHDALRDNTAAGRAAWASVQDRLLAELDGVDVTGLEGSAEWLTAGILREALEAGRAVRVCRAEEWDVDQVWGWQIWFGELALAQPVETPKDRTRALDRWRQLPGFIDNEIHNLRSGLADGFSAPKRNVDLVIGQINGLLDLAPADSPFFAVARDSEDEAFRARWLALISDQINPAIVRYRNFLADEYRPRARDAISVTEHPEGAACYRAQLRRYTTVPYTGEEMFAAGKEAVALREERIQEIGERLFGTADLAEIRRRLRDDRENRFDSRDEIMEYTRAAVDRGREALPDWFGHLPEAEVIIRPVPEYQERSSTARYVGASDDGRLPGTYYVNLFQPGEQNRGEVESVAFHETYPGHHLQIALARERSTAHPATRYIGNSGFNEGWARYSETLADEMGLYSSDLNTLYMLSGLPTGMVVDPGIHAMGWTRDEAIAYSLAKQVNMTPEEAATYVDRIVVWPGQMTTYGAGELEIVRLRLEAEATLIGDFDIREFHDRVLGNGSVTLGMLRDEISSWLAERQSEQD